MRRMILGLAFAVLAMGPPSPVRAGEAEDRQAAQEIAGILRDSGTIHNYNVGVKYKKGTRLAGRPRGQQRADGRGPDAGRRFG